MGVLQKAAKIVPTGAGDAVRGLLLSRIGSLQLAESEYEEAVHTLEAALESLIAAGDQAAAAQCQLTLGMAIEAMGHDPHPRCVHQRGDGDLTAALAYEATLQWAVEANDIFVAGRAHASLARSHYAGGRLVLA